MFYGSYKCPIDYRELEHVPKPEDSFSVESSAFLFFSFFSCPGLHDLTVIIQEASVRLLTAAHASVITVRPYSRLSRLSLSQGAT